MLIALSNATIYDPAHGIEGEVGDLWIRDGRIVPPPDQPPDREFDLTGRVIMAGAIDLHTHIGGGKTNIARMLLPERGGPPAESAREAGARARRSLGGYLPGTFEAGYRYAEMGYTACFEPAVLPSGARHAHLEMADTPIIDTGGYVVLGNDDLLLGMLAAGVPQPQINDAVAWMMRATQCLGVKVVNPGGINAFKYNLRHLDVDEPNPRYGVTPRQVVARLARALDELGVPHPLHVHCSNLGVPGNYASTLATIAAAEGRPLHLAHVQFHSYGTGGPRGFSSEAASIAAAVAQNPNVTVDIGQVVFGQTTTLSADTMHQFANRRLARPRKWACVDYACEAGCGVVPFRYSHQAFIHSLQWAIGLELLLMIPDPSRVFLTTDHPNGGPFTSYPHLIRLLRDRTYRAAALEQIHPDAAAASSLAGMDREYTLAEIATLTRAAPARILGLRDHGHLAPGALADIVVYRADANAETMFARPELVFRRGEVVVRDGQVIAEPAGRTHVVRPELSGEAEPAIRDYFARHLPHRPESFAISDDEMGQLVGSPAEPHPCRHERIA